VRILNIEEMGQVCQKSHFREPNVDGPVEFSR
jgi:hypothetical protein